MPVFVSTRRSVQKILPLCGYTVPSERISSGELLNKSIGCPVELRCFARRYSCSLTGNFNGIDLRN